MGSPKRYSARAEAVRCADEAIRRIRAGETISAIHDDLTERREITMALRTFMQWMRRLENDSPYVPLSESTSTSQNRKEHAEQSKSHRLTNRPAENRNGERSKPSTQLRDQPSTAGGAAREVTTEPKRIRMGTPIPSPLNTEPDNVALFGEDQ